MGGLPEVEFLKAQYATFEGDSISGGCLRCRSMFRGFHLLFIRSMNTSKALLYMKWPNVLQSGMCRYYKSVCIDSLLSVNRN